MPALYRIIASVFEEHSITNVKNAEVAVRIGVPIHLIQFVLALEDKRFWAHPGIDLISINRALLMKIMRRGCKQGASTIPEQLIKVRRCSPRRASLVERTRRAGASLRLCLKETKIDILSEYLERVYMGKSSYGITSATRAYFHCSPSELTPAQSFFLSERLALPNKWRPARIANILRRKLIRNLLDGHLVNLSPIYGAFFGARAKAEVDKIICQIEDDCHES